MNEVVGNPTGNPIEMTHPYPPGSEDRMKEDATKMIADRRTVAEASRQMGIDGDKPGPTVSNPDLRRQVEEVRLGKIQPRFEKEGNTYETASTQALEASQNLNGFGVFFEIVKRLKGNETLEEKGLRLHQIALEAGEKIKQQQEKIGIIQKLITEDPDMLPKLVERAYDEALIVQRIALGFAIREAVGNGGLQNEQNITRFVELYNKGDFKIEQRHYKLGSGVLNQFIEDLRANMYDNDSFFGRSDFGMTPQKFFDPINQTKAALTR